jgi:putative spermidine/putrescine transport system ATP-binding protein
MHDTSETLRTQVAVRDLCKRYAGAPAVDRISFEVAQGMLLTLLGPSGSGKTTTLMMIAGFVEPDSGTIAISGRDVTALPPNRRGLGVVFQSYALFPHKSVFENVAFPLVIRRRPRAEIAQRVARMLDRVGLAALRDRSPAQLSGGQRQRVALARALVFEPPVLLMDEPLGALDKKLREQMQQEIKSLQSALAVTAIYVTHDQEEALALSDRLAVMREGRLLQIGTPAQLYDEPSSRFVAEALGSLNLLPVSAVRRRGAACEAVLPGGVRAPCRASAALSGGGAWLGIRPQRLRLGGAGDGLFTAEIRYRVYLGGHIDYQLAGPQGLLLQARRPAGEGERVWEPGERVAVSWAAEAAWLFD